MQYPLSESQKKSLHQWLDRHLAEFTNERYFASYTSWAKGGNWHRTFATGGTYTMQAIMWYHHIHKPGSSEWRPKIIMDAICKQAGVTDQTAAA